MRPRRSFIKVFSKGQVPDEMPEINVGAGPHKIAALIVKAGLGIVNSDAIRKIREGAVSLVSRRCLIFGRITTSTSMWC